MQLELGSVDGTISLAEHRIRLSVQGDMDMVWQIGEGGQDCARDTEFDRQAVESEVVNVKERKMESAASTMATSSGGGGSTIGYRTLGAQSGLCLLELKGECGVTCEARGSWRTR